MRKLSLCLLAMLFAVCVLNPLCAFENEKEHAEAVKKVNEIKDQKTRSEILDQIKLGNIDTIKKLEQVLSESKVEYGYYDSIDRGTRDQALKIQLGKLIRNHTSLGYSGARKVMYGILDNVNGKVEGIYSGTKFPYKRTVMLDGKAMPGVNTGAKIARGQKHFLNCEHVWPQSFFNKKEPMRSDIHHLMSADAVPNGIRGHFPFSVVSEQTHSNPGLPMEPSDEGALGRSIFSYSQISLCDTALS